MYGVMRAVAADFTGRGRLDIAAVSYLPPEWYPRRQEQKLDAVVYLEQVAPGRFVRHRLETGTCDHLTCAAGDLFNDGRVHLVTGAFSLNPTSQGAAGVRIWENPGR
jgi:hypothetical protein